MSLPSHSITAMLTRWARSMPQNVAMGAKTCSKYLPQFSLRSRGPNGRQAASKRGMHRHLWTARGHRTSRPRGFLLSLSRCSQRGHAKTACMCISHLSQSSCQLPAQRSRKRERSKQGRRIRPPLRAGRCCWPPFALDLQPPRLLQRPRKASKSRNRPWRG